MNWGQCNKEGNHEQKAYYNHNCNYISNDKNISIIDQTSLQLYLHLINGLDLENKKIAEISSGKGGGLCQIADNYSKSTCIGIDICKGNINQTLKFANKINNLYFMLGDAMEFQNNRNKISSKDNLKLEELNQLINVEASHCYPNREVFVDQCYKALQVRGSLLFADFFKSSEDVDLFRKNLIKRGFEIDIDENISNNVIKAMELTDNPKKCLIDEQPPFYLNQFIKKFASVKDSNSQLDLKNQKYYQHHFRAIKT